MSIHIPTHRADVPCDPSFSEARCPAPYGCGYNCPRHRPGDYAQNYARHATDSIAPLTPEQVRAERYHASTAVGR